MHLLAERVFRLVGSGRNLNMPKSLPHLIGSRRTHQREYQGLCPLFEGGCPVLRAMLPRGLDALAQELLHISGVAGHLDRKLLDTHIVLADAQLGHVDAQMLVVRRPRSRGRQAARGAGYPLACSIRSGNCSQCSGRRCAAAPSRSKVRYRSDGLPSTLRPSATYITAGSDLRFASSASTYACRYRWRGTPSDASSRTRLARVIRYRTPQASTEGSRLRLAGAAKPSGRPSSLKRSRHPDARPALHSTGHMPRQSRNTRSHMSTPYAKYQSFSPGSPLSRTQRSR